MKNNKNFIVTRKEEVKDNLLKQGYKLLKTNNNSMFVFLNDPDKKISFNKDECNEVIFTDKLCL